MTHTVSTYLLTRLKQAGWAMSLVCPAIMC